MVINDKKCKILFFKRSNVFVCLLPNNLFGIETCNSLKLLGVTFNDKLNFKDHFTEILRHTAQRLYFLRILKKHYQKDKLWPIYYTLLRSILEYAAPLFANLPKSICRDIEKIQKRAHRIICGIQRTNTCHDCHIISLEDRRTYLAQRLFDKMIKNDSHPLANLLPPKRSNHIFIVPHINTNCFRVSFVIKCILTANNTVNL